MKGVFKWAALAVVAFIGVGVIANMQEEDREPAAAGVSISASPTERPTPEPTERPTPRPTPEPVADGWLEYLTHTIAYADLFIADTEALSAAAASFDMNELTDVSIEMWSNLGDELLWLDSNPPDDCYALSHGAYRHAISLYYEAMDVISDGAIYRDFDMIEEGTVMLDEATLALDESADVVETITCP